MALVVKARVAPDQASVKLFLEDITLPYDAINNITGYNSPNRAASDNIVTEIVPTFPDGTAGTTLTLDGTTTPSTDWIPKNGLSRYLTLAQLGWSGATWPTGLIKLTYRPWFTTASGGLVGVTLGSPTVTRQSGQNFTSDFADSYKIRLNGVNYTIAAGGIAATTLTLTTNYTGSTVTNATAYIGYEANIAAVIDREFKQCFMPRYIANRPPNKCDKGTMSTLIKLRYQWDSVYALQATPDFDAANELMIDITEDCACLASGTISGCSSCIS